MTNRSTEVWTQASKIYAQISALSVQDALHHLQNSITIDDEIKQAVISLMNAQSHASDFFDNNIKSSFKQPINKPFAMGNKIGEYELLEEIGQGGMSQVFKARRIGVEPQKLVAIKIFAPTTRTQELLTHFINEQKLLADLSHPNIVDLMHGGTSSDDIAYLVMSLVEEALPLDDYCQQRNLSTKQKIKLIYTCSKALAYLHANLIVHRDLKPDNILVNKHDELKIVDFGIAKLINNDLTGNKTTLIALTPSYAAPEQINCEAISVKTDIFSLAVIALDLLSEHKPLPKDRLMKSCINDEEHITQLFKTLKIDSDLKNILTTALQQNPEKRYATMDKFGEDIDAWLHDMPVSATGNSLLYRLKRFAKRRTALFASLLTLIATLFIAMLAMSWQYQQTVKEKLKAVEIKDFMLNLFAMVDPEKSVGTNLTAVELLDFATNQLEEKKFDDKTIEADILSNIGTSFINLGANLKGEKLLLDALLADPNNIQAKLKLAQYYVDSTQTIKANHLINALDKIEQKNTKKSDTSYQIDLLKASKLKLSAQFEEAIKLARQSYTGFSKLENSQGMIKSARIIADILTELGDYQEAISIIQKTIKQTQTHVSTISPEFLRLNIKLAVIFSQKNKHKLAIEQINSTLKKIDQKLGDSHPLIIIAFAEAATIHRYAGHYKQALLNANHSYTLAQDKYGKNSKLSQNALFVIADIKFSQGQFDQALADYTRVIEMSKVNYGRWNYITLSGEIGFSNFYLANNMKEKAIGYAKNTYLKIQQKFGTENELSIFALNTYIDISLKANEITQDSINLLHSNHLIAQKVLGENHPQTIYSQNIMKKINQNVP